MKKIIAPFVTIAVIVTLVLQVVQRMSESTLKASRVGIPRALRTLANSLVAHPDRADLPDGFGPADGDPHIATNGRYLLRAYFVLPDGSACTECGLFALNPDHEHASDFAIYAWPQRAGKSGDYSYCIDENATPVLCASNRDGSAWRYSGAEAPTAGAAGPVDGDWSAPLGVDVPAQDGQSWWVID